jgi:osomolarity two-component system sensor histidine kinase NIK1
MGQGGFEATGKIREYERSLGTQRTPIIALTAHAMMGDRERCIQAQMDEYLSKPLQQNHLIQTILKCATLGGQLLEKNREQEITRAADAASSTRRDTANRPAFQAAAAVLRPSLTSRAITAAGETLPGGLESPALVSGATDEDPLTRVRSNLSEPNIHMR